MIATPVEAERVIDHFVQRSKAKYSTAVQCLTKDCEARLPFYDFPGRTLGGAAHNKPDLVHVRDYPPSHGPSQGLRDA
jgi:hypothetical protein